MRIEQIELFLVEVPLRTPFITRFGTKTVRPCILVHLEGDTTEGWGECVAEATPSYFYETVETAWYILRTFIVPYIMGIDLQDATDLLHHLDHINGHAMAISAVEHALWDALGRATDRALATMLGGTRTEIPVGVSIGFHRTPDALVETVGQYLDQGYQRVKVKIGPQRDLAFVLAVRMQFPHIALSVDANGAYTLEDYALLRQLDDYNLLMIEQPLAAGDLLDHAVLQQKLRTPICLDESICSVADARHAIALQSCQSISIKPGRVGGLVRSKQIHDLCSDAGIPVWCGGMLETTLGRATNVALASLPNFQLPNDISASARYYTEDIAGPPYTLTTQGTITVSALPGSGVVVDRAALDRMLVRYERFDKHAALQK